MSCNLIIIFLFHAREKVPSLVRLVLCSLVVFFVGDITVESNLTYRLVNHELCYLPFFFDKPYIYVENSNTHIGIKHVLACMKASTWRSSQELQPQIIHVSKSLYGRTVFSVLSFGCRL